MSFPTWYSQKYYNNNKLVSVFFDIAGAFNNVNIEVLCTELLPIGIPGKLVHWIREFLFDIKVFIKYNGGLFGSRLSSMVCVKVEYYHFYSVYTSS